MNFWEYNRENGPTIQIINKFLLKTGIRVDCLRISGIFNGHPLPHSIRAISDTLDSIGVNNMVYSIPSGHTDCIPTPSIVFMKGKEGPFLIFEGEDAHGRMALLSGTKRKFYLEKEAFETRFAGICLAVDIASEVSGVKPVTYYIRQALWTVSKHSIQIMACILSVFAIWSILYNGNTSGNMAIAGTGFLLLAFDIIGMAISAIAIYKYHFNTPWAENICRLNRKDGCRNALLSKDAIVLGWISLGDLAFAYFLSVYIWLTAFPQFIEIVTICSAFSLIPVIYSIIWQAKKHNACTLCLSIDAIVIASWAIALSNVNRMEFHLATIVEGLSGFALIFLTMLLSVTAICGLMQKARQCTEFENRHEVLLCQPNLLSAIAFSQRQIITRDDLDNIFTIRTVPEKYRHWITIAINPNCRHCGDILEVLNSLDGNRLDILLITSDEDIKAKEAAKEFLSIASTHDIHGWDKAKSAMEAWYIHGSLLSTGCIEHEKAGELLRQNIELCRNVGIYKTPTILIDGKLLPEIYAPEDIRYII